MYQLTVSFDSIAQLQKFINDSSFDPQAVNTPAPVIIPALDVNNTPWDIRIHSSGRSVTAAGVWVKRRGVDKEVYDQVMLDIATVIPEPAAPEPLAPEPLAPEPAQAVIRYENMQEALAQLANVVSKVIGEGAVLPQDIMGEYKKCGVDNLDQLNSDLTLVNNAIEHFGSKSA